MAKQPGLDFQSAKGGLGELKRRLLFVIGALIVFRIGSFIPIPGIDAAVLAKLLEQQRGTIIEMFNMFSGGALSRASIFALGIMPYISASIIIQLLTVVHPTLAEIKKEGESGRRKISQYTRYGTLVLAIFAGLPPAIAHTIEQARQGDLHFLVLLLVAVLVFAVTFFVVFVERGQRRIVVNYAKRQQGRRVYAAQSTHLPLKVNMAGVIPAIFASSIILFPATIASWFGGGTGWNWLTTISLYLQPGQPLYVLLYASAIIFFCFFYTALVFNPRETADNLKKSGAFVPGIRPGEQTAKYIDKVMTRLTLVGALYITFICLIPEFMRDAMKVPFYFGGTSLLIVVVVIMDFMAQVQTLMMSSQYESALKKANLKGYGR